MSSLSPDQFGPLVVRHEPDEHADHHRVSAWFAHDDEDHRLAGYLSHKPAADGSTEVRVLHVEDDRRRMGVGSALMDALAQKHPVIDHGERTPDGQKWWAAYKSRGGKA